MATESNSNTLDYTQDIINIVDAIDRVKDELVSLNTKTENQNVLLQLIVDELVTMDDTHAEYLNRASTSSLGIYTTGVIGPLSRALMMTSISEEQLQELADEINNPTPLPGDNG